MLRPFKNIKNKTKYLAKKLQKEEKKANPFTVFPNEILLKIFGYCDPIELKILEKVCHTSRALIHAHYFLLWKQFLTRGEKDSYLMTSGHYRANISDFKALLSFNLYSIDTNQISLKSFLLHPTIKPVYHYTKFLLDSFDNNLSAAECLDKLAHDPIYEPYQKELRDKLVIAYDKERCMGKGVFVARYMLLRFLSKRYPDTTQAYSVPHLR